MVARITEWATKTCFAALHRDVVQTLQEIRRLLQVAKSCCRKWFFFWQKNLYMFTWHILPAQFMA